MDPDIPEQINPDMFSIRSLAGSVAATWTPPRLCIRLPEPSRIRGSNMNIYPHLYPATGA